MAKQSPEEFPLGSVPKRPLIPYEKKIGTLDGFSVEHQEIETNHGLLGKVEISVSSTYVLKETRNGQTAIIDSINMGWVDIWHGRMNIIMREILVSLNDPSSYRWEEIKKPILEYWHGQQDSAARAAKLSGGTAWTPMMDSGVDKLMSFIASVLGSKQELLKALPANLEEYIKAPDFFEAQIAQMAFDEAIARQSIESILDNPEISQEEKGKEIVSLVVQYWRMVPHLNSKDLLDPEYQDDEPMLSTGEEYELTGLWNLYNNIEKDFDALPSKEERMLAKHEFWETETGKRLNTLNNRRVYGAGMSFKAKEEKKRKAAYRIAAALQYFLFSWELPITAAESGKEEYFTLYSEAVWRREKREIDLKQMLEGGYSQIRLLKDLLKGGWDSNSITFVGIVVGIAVSLLLGFVGIFLIFFGTNILGVLSSVSLGIGISSACLATFLLALDTYRIPIMKWARKTLHQDEPSQRLLKNI